MDATAALLSEVFPGTRLSRSDYLRWLYEEAPSGRVIETNIDDRQGRAAHYALVPVDLVADGVLAKGALSLNTGVHERLRGRGVFVQLAADTIAAARRQGIATVLGVANANSTPGFVRRLEFELVTPLPATVLVPLPGRRHGLRSGWASEAAFATGGLAADASPLLTQPPRGIARVWTPETLRWRLASPGARYALHRGTDVLVVSAVDRRRSMPVAVILGIFASRRVDGAMARAIVRCVCRFHRAPLALHVGVNDRVALRGLPLPERLRESPLNLIYRDLRGGQRHGSFARFEFIDFDAY
jgi:GNAT superfamily N-acetyltransferase